MFSIICSISILGVDSYLIKYQIVWGIWYIFLSETELKLTHPAVFLGHAREKAAPRTQYLSSITSSKTPACSILSLKSVRFEFPKFVASPDSCGTIFSIFNSWNSRAVFALGEILALSLLGQTTSGEGLPERTTTTGGFRAGLLFDADAPDFLLVKKPGTLTIYLMLK